MRHSALKAGAIALVTLVGSTVISANEAIAAPSAAEIQDHYKTVENQIPYTERVCRQKSGGQGALEGALIGGILGEALGGGNKDTRNGLAIFGGIVGANEAQKQTVCENVTKYRTEYVRQYSHSTITFEYNGVTRTITFNK